MKLSDFQPGMRVVANIPGLGKKYGMIARSFSKAGVEWFVRFDNDTLGKLTDDNAQFFQPIENDVSMN